MANDTKALRFENGLQLDLMDAKAREWIGNLEALSGEIGGEARENLVAAINALLQRIAAGGGESGGGGGGTQVTVNGSPVSTLAFDKDPQNQIGDLDEIQTENKMNLVYAINEVNEKIEQGGVDNDRVIHYRKTYDLTGKFLEGSYIDDETGEVKTYVGWEATDYLDCRGFKRLEIQSTYIGKFNAFYDEDKVFIGNFGGDVVNIPDNACYARMSFQGGTVPPEEAKAHFSVVAVGYDEPETGNVYGNHFNPARALDAMRVEPTGAVVRSPDPVISSDLIAIPEFYPGIKYKNLVTLKQQGMSFSYAAAYIVFYAADGYSLIGYHENQTITSIPAGARFVRVTFVTTDSKNYYVGFQNKTTLPDYSPYSPKIPYDVLEEPATFVENTDGAVTNLLNVAMQYVRNAEFGYESDHTLFDDECGGKYPTTRGYYEGNKYQIDCSAFVKACLDGIPVMGSRYIDGNSDNEIPEWAYNWSKIADGETVYADGEQSGNHGRMYANKIAEYACKSGYLYRVKRDNSNIEPGDVIFFGGTEQWASLKFWETVGHCAIVTQKVRLKAGGYAIKYVHATSGSDYGVDEKVVTPSDVHILYGARFPLQDVYSEKKVLSQEVTGRDFTVNGTGGYELVAQLDLVKPLKNGRVYTVAFKADLPDNSWVEYWVGSDILLGMNFVGTGDTINNSAIAHSKSGVYVGHIEIDKSVVLGDETNKILKVYVRCVDTVGGDAHVYDAKLIEGYATISNHEFD